MISPLILIFLIPLVIILSFFYVLPWIIGAPFEATNKKKLKKIIELADIQKGEKIVDLGSGDGRIVIASALKGAEAHGFEVNPFLVLLSRFKIKRLGLQDRAFIYFKSFWNIDFKKYDIVILFQFRTIMKRLERKLKKELKKNSKVVSFYWKFPSWEFIRNYENIYLYKKK